MVHEFGRIKTGSVVADVETTETSQMIPPSSGHMHLKEASPVSCVVKTSAFVRVCVFCGGCGIMEVWEFPAETHNFIFIPTHLGCDPTSFFRFSWGIFVPQIRKRFLGFPIQSHVSHHATSDNFRSS